MSEMEATFQHQASFEAGEIAGNMRLGKLEAMYEELFAEVIEDGVITQDERSRLDKMADNLGLDRNRLRKLEQQETERGQQLEPGAQADTADGGRAATGTTEASANGNRRPFVMGAGNNPVVVPAKQSASRDP